MRVVSCLGSFVVALAFAGCGSSDKDELFKDDGTTGPTETPSPDGGSMGSDPFSVQCENPLECPHDPGQSPCCTRDFKCGVRLGKTPNVACLSLNQPGVEDNSCDDTIILGTLAVGCCRPNGTCGYLDLKNELGVGCVSPLQLNEPEGKACGASAASPGP